MAIDKKLIYCETKEQFTTKNTAGEFNNSSIVFIKSTGELWTHGKFFGGYFSSADSNKVTITLGGSSYTLATSGHTHPYVPLTGNSTINISAFYGLTLKRQDANGAGIQFSNSAGPLMGIGVLSGPNFIISSGSGTGGDVMQATTAGVKANAFIKTGGTANQFLKANGSVDSNVYVTESGSIASAKRLQSYKAITSWANVTVSDFINYNGLVHYNNENGTLDTNGFPAANTSAGFMFGKSNSAVIFATQAGATTGRIYIKQYYQSWSDWFTLLHSGNIAEYALTKTGNFTRTSGKLSLTPNLYSDALNSGALNLQNSNIDGVNSIYFADLADSAAEGIHFYTDSTHVDTIHSKSGVLYYTPNRTIGAAGSPSTIFHTSNYTSWVPTKTGGGATGTWAISITGTAELAKAANLVNGTYTGSGGRQPPSYVPSGKVRFNMMNNSTNGNTVYKDFMLMDTYTGGDVPYVTAIGVSKASTPVAFVMSGKKGETDVTKWVTAELLGSNNYTNFVPTKTGTGASGTWGISITGNAATASSAAKWTTARTLTITGDSTGSVSMDGSANVTCSVTNKFIKGYRTAQTAVSSAWGLGAYDGGTGFSNYFFGTTRTSSIGYIGITRAESGMLGLSAYHNILAFGNGDTHAMIGMNYNSGMVIVGGGSADKLTWYKTLAFTDSSITGNAASATKLQTARTIWGQSFNGTANVSGAMTGVSTITASSYFKSTLATGTAPIQVTSTTVCTNLNADTVDGYHESSFLRYRGSTGVTGEDTLWSQIGLKMYSSALPDGIPTGTYAYGEVVTLPTSSNRFEIYAPHTGSATGDLYFRTGYDTNKQPWAKIISSANISKITVGKADQLTTSRSLWGNSFNGTADINGQITASNGIVLPYTGSSWLSMVTRTGIIRGAVQQTDSSAHSLFMVKNNAGDAIAFGGLGANIGFYGFDHDRIANNTNSYKWGTVWNANTGNITHSTNITAANLIKTGSSDSYVLLGGGGHVALSESATASTVVKRNSSGYINAKYFYSDIADENPTIGSVYVRNTSDNYIRRMSFSNFMTDVRADIANNYACIRAIYANSYYGMGNPTGADNVWIRTTTQGILPYQSGGAGAGHQSLGTSSWYFDAAYIDDVYSTGFHKNGYSDNYVLLAGGGALTQTTSATANTIVKRDSDGDIFARRFYTSTSDENSMNISSIYVRSTLDTAIRCIDWTVFKNKVAEGLTVTDITGNAGTSDKWKTARTLELTNHASGAVSIDGSRHVTLSVSNNWADTSYTTSYLKYNSAFSAGGNDRVSYYSSSSYPSNSVSYNGWASPASGAWQTLHIDSETSGYFTELLFPKDSNTGIRYRRRRSSTYDGWYTLLDSSNYADFITLDHASEADRLVKKYTDSSIAYKNLRLEAVTGPSNNVGMQVWAVDSGMGYFLSIENTGFSNAKMGVSRIASNGSVVNDGTKYLAWADDIVPESVLYLTTTDLCTERTNSVTLNSHDANLIKTVVLGTAGTEYHFVWVGSTSSNTSMKSFVPVTVMSVDASGVGLIALLYAGYNGELLTSACMSTTVGDYTFQVPTATGGDNFVKKDFSNITSKNWGSWNSTGNGSGYYKLPDGLLIQWGKQLGAGDLTRVTFPTSFLNLEYSIQFTGEAMSASERIVYAPQMYSRSVGSCSLYTRYMGNGGTVELTAWPFLWIAIGHWK